MMRCLNFTPTEEQQALMTTGGHDAMLDLAFLHNILFLPELHSWALANGDEAIEAYRTGRMSADECKAYFGIA